MKNMSLLTNAKRSTDDGRTELTIADGLIYIDIFRGKQLIEQRTFKAEDLIELNIDRALLANGWTWSDWKASLRARR